MDKKTLIIVESPAKAKTIEKYLGDGYAVSASMGHLVDLPKSRLAVDVEHGFEPEYITIRGKAKILNGLRQAAGRATEVLLASDNDREGEAISHHLRNAILAKKPNLSVRRIVFNEITPQVIREAVAHPGEIDGAKVEAQKARRVLDRLVGYHLSPILWKKVKNGLSAGRVQSVALRLVCEREAEVESFLPEEYWSLEAELKKGRSSVKAALAEYRDAKPELKSEQAVQAIVAALQGVEFRVADVRVTEKTLKPKAPLTTSKLQQEAANRFGFTSRKTMQVAQSLYEGVDIGSGRVGLITYMRTDSTRVSATALEEVRAFLAEHYPAELPAEAALYTPAAKAQDAHEAIRPTYVLNTPGSVKSSLAPDQFKLYSLIWERFVSSQMTPARTATTTVDFRAGEALFRASSTKVVTPGFQRVLAVLAAKEGGKALPALAVGEVLELQHFLPEQHFTSGPARYTDATIIKALEEKGIGRPSTYAPIISVLLDRYYVVRKSRQLAATQLGRIINNLLTAQFPALLDENFTASLEKKLDEVEERKERWEEVVAEFYRGFKVQVDHVHGDPGVHQGSDGRAHRVHLREVRQAPGEKAGPLRFLPRLHRLPGLPQHPGRAAGRLSAARLRRQDHRPAPQGRSGQGVLRLHQLPPVRIRDLLQAFQLQVPPVRLLPGGKAGQAAGRLQGLHQPAMRLPARPGAGSPPPRGGGGPECLRLSCSTCGTSAPGRPHLDGLLPGSGAVPAVPGVKRRCAPNRWARPRRAVSSAFFPAAA